MDIWTWRGWQAAGVLVAALGLAGAGFWTLYDRLIAPDAPERVFAIPLEDHRAMLAARIAELRADLARAGSAEQAAIRERLARLELRLADSEASLQAARRAEARLADELGAWRGLEAFDIRDPESVLSLVFVIEDARRDGAARLFETVAAAALGAQAACARRDRLATLASSPPREDDAMSERLERMLAASLRRIEALDRIAVAAALALLEETTPDVMADAAELAAARSGSGLASAAILRAAAFVGSLRRGPFPASGETVCALARQD